MLRRFPRQAQLLRRATSAQSSASAPFTTSTAALEGPVEGPFVTHDVFNQAVQLQNYNAFTSDTAMVEAVEKYGCGGSTHDTLSSFGAAVGSADTLEMTRLAHENKPILRNYDKYGNRIDVIEYHPAYHEAMSLGIRNQVGRRTVVAAAGLL